MKAAKSGSPVPDPSTAASGMLRLAALGFRRRA